MKRFWLIFAFFIFIFLFYLLFVPKKIYSKEIFAVDKFFSISGGQIFPEISPKGYFFNDKECGFFSADQGMIFYHQSEDPNEFIYANKLFYILYHKTGEFLKTYSNKGEFLNSYNALGYPYIASDLPYFYLIKSNGMGFSLFSISGDALLKDIGYSSLITSLHMDQNMNTLVSLVDGRSYLVNIKGEVVFERENLDPGIKVAKSNALDPAGHKIALCTGIDPEYIEIYDIPTGSLLKKFETETHFRYESFLCFSQERIYYEGEKSLKYYDLEKDLSGTIKLQGEILEVDFNEKNGNILTATHDKDFYYLTVYSKEGDVLFYKEFLEPLSDINFTDERTFYVRLDRYIIKMKLGIVT